MICKNDELVDIYDLRVAKLFSLFILINVMNTFIKSFALFPTINSSIISIGLGSIYFFYLLKNLRFFNKAITLLIFVEGLFCLTMLVSIIINYSVKDLIIKRCVWTILFCIPMSVLIGKMKKPELILNYSENSAIISLVLIGFAIYFGKNNLNGFAYNMQYGYLLLYPVLLYSHKIFDDYKLKYLIIVIVGCSLILLYTSRGPILCILMYLLSRYLFDKTIIKRYLKIFLAIAFIVVVFVFSEQILIFVGKILSSFGINSRTFTLLINGTITSDSGRTVIWKDMLSKISQKPLLGWGVAGELNFMKTYPHLIFLELLIHYGVTMGVLLSVFIIILLVYHLNKYEFNGSLQIFLACGVIPLLLSGTYLQNPFFWIFMALSIKKFRYQFCIRRANIWEK